MQRIVSAHPEMANLHDIFVARKILSSKYQPYVCGKIFRAPRSQPNFPISGWALFIVLIVFFCLPVSVSAFTLEGQLTQGGMAIGKVDPGAAVRFQGASVRVSPEGLFVVVAFPGMPNRPWRSKFNSPPAK